jgi:hypothetical protein
MLLDDDVVTDGKAKACALSGWLSCKEWVEHLFFDVRRNTGPVIADTNFDTIAKVLGRSRQSRLVVAIICLCSALGRSIEAICNQIKKSTPDVLRENVCPTGRRIKRVLELDLKTLRLATARDLCHRLADERKNAAMSAISAHRSNEPNSMIGFSGKAADPGLPLPGCFPEAYSVPATFSSRMGPPRGCECLYFHPLPVFDRYDVG